MPERTANSHNHVEIVAVHDRLAGHLDAAESAHDVCMRVAAARGLCEYDRIAASAPGNAPVVFPVAPMAHCDLDSIIRRLRGGATSQLARYFPCSHVP